MNSNRLMTCATARKEPAGVVGLRPGSLVFASPEPLSAFLGTSGSTNQEDRLSYFTIRIGMTAEEIAPGMPVEAFVQTGERTMISYLMKPLHDH